jgi:type IV pilus assembly protein PilF
VINNRIRISARLACLALVAALAGCAAQGDTAPADRVATGGADASDAERRARVRLELAGAYFANGQVETALEELRLALAAYPGLAEAYNLRALAYASLGDDALADENFRRAIQMSPADGSALHNRGWFHCQRGRFAQAQADFSAAMALPQYRDRSRTQLARGVCFARNSQWPEAEMALMRAYELDPSNPGTGFNLAEVLYRRQNFERARFYINRVNDTAGATNAQTLWLAVRIEHQLGRDAMVRVLGEQLRTRFPRSPEATLYDRGRFDD